MEKALLAAPPSPRGEELTSNVVFARFDSGGTPAGLNRSLVHAIDEPHTGDNVGELLESSKSSPALLGTHRELVDHRETRASRETTLGLIGA